MTSKVTETAPEATFALSVGLGTQVPVSRANSRIPPEPLTNGWTYTTTDSPASDSLPAELVLAADEDGPDTTWTVWAGPWIAWFPGDETLLVLE